MKKIYVVYDSENGHTELLAKAIATSNLSATGSKKARKRMACFKERAK